MLLLELSYTIRVLTNSMAAIDRTSQHLIHSMTLAVHIIILTV